MRWGILDDDGGYFHCIIYTSSNLQMTLRYLSVLCQTLAPKEPPHSPHLILPEKMLTPLYLPPSRLRRVSS